MKKIFKDIRKKSYIIEVIILIIVLGAGFFLSNIKGVEKEPKVENDFLREVTVEKYIQLLRSDEISVIYIGQPSCPHCQRAKPVLMEIAEEYQLTINYVDTSKFDNETYTAFNNSHVDFKEGRWGVPLIIIVSDNKIIDKQAGFPQENGKEIYLNFFYRNNVIDKK